MSSAYQKIPLRCVTKNCERSRRQLLKNPHVNAASKKSILQNNYQLKNSVAFDRLSGMNTTLRNVGGILLVTLAMMVSGCAVLDALDKYHYIGVYEVSYKKQKLDAHDWELEFDRFCEALKKETGYGINQIMRDSSTKMSCVVVPPSVTTGLDRVVITQSQDDELSISIVKIPAGEDAETTELKHHIEAAFRAVGISDWTFYLQRSHGQFFVLKKSENEQHHHGLSETALR